MNNEEKILSMLEQMNTRFDKMDARMDKIETDTRQTRILVEQQQHQIQLIAEQYGNIAEKLDRVESLYSLRDRVQVLENIVMSMNAEIKVLKKAQ